MEHITLTYYLLKACIFEVTLLTVGAWEGTGCSSSKLINESEALRNTNKKEIKRK